MKKEKQSYVWMIVVQSILYGLMDVVAKMTYQWIPVYCFLFLRYVLAAGIMAALWGKEILRDLMQVPVKRYLLPGVCMAAAFIFSNLALMFTSATNMSFIRSLSALIVPVLMLLGFRQKISRRELVLEGGMLVGLYLLCAKGGLGGFGLGEVFALIAASLVAGSLAFGKNALTYVSAKTLSFVQSALAAVFCGVAAGLCGDLAQITAAASPKVLCSLGYAAVGCTIGGYMLQNVALERGSARKIGMVQCLYPIAAAGFAFVVLNERLSISGMLGAGIITCCVLLENAGKQTK